MSFARESKTVDGYEWLGGKVEIVEPTWGELEPLLDNPPSEIVFSRKLIALCVYVDGEPLGDRMNDIGMSKVKHLLELVEPINQIVGLEEITEKKD